MFNINAYTSKYNRQNDGLTLSITYGYQSESTTEHAQREFLVQPMDTTVEYNPW